MPSVRRLLTLTAVALTGAGAILGAGSSPVSAAGGGRPSGPFVDIIEITGYLDPVTDTFIRDSVAKATKDGAQVLVIQLDSPGSVLPAADLDALENFLRTETKVPVAVWVGPNGARVHGGAVRLVRGANIVGVANQTHVGRSTPAPGGTGTSADQLIERALADKDLGAKDMVKLNAAAFIAPVLPDFIGQLDGKTVGGKQLETAKPPRAADQRSELRTVRFQKLGLLPRLLHTMTNPSIAYLLLAIGVSLMIFEFYTGGVGVAAGVGLACAGLSAYGLGLLPTRPVGLALLGVAFLGFAIDIQAGTPRFWTGIGTAAMVLGSLLLFSGDTRVPLYWIALVTSMVVLAMVAGMPTMVRTRFATPTIGRESMIGEFGEASTAVDPDGVVIVRGAPWRARTNRATPLMQGDRLRVSAIDGLVLEVEPLEGAARDHRERRPTAPVGDSPVSPARPVS